MTFGFNRYNNPWRFGATRFSRLNFIILLYKVIIINIIFINNDLLYLNINIETIIHFKNMTMSLSSNDICQVSKAIRNLQLKSYFKIKKTELDLRD